MNDSSFSPDELDDLIITLTTRRLTSAEGARLDAILNGSEAARAYYRRYVALHVMLEAVNTPVPSEALASPEVKSSSAYVGEVAPPVRTPTVLSQAATWLGESLNYREHIVRFSILAALATGWFWVWFFTFFMGPRANSPSSQPNPIARPAASSAPIVARVSGMHHCRWREGEFREGSALRSGQLLQLDRGAAEVSFRDGGHVILRAPARFVVLTANSAHLEVGELTARLPRPMSGFEISTPVARIIDLGTEFGVRVNVTGETEAHCFTGRIAAHSLRDEASPYILSARESLRISPSSASSPAGAAAFIPYQPHDFVRQLPKRESGLAYPAVVESLAPRGYWRFEEPAASRVAHDTSGRSHLGQLQGDARIEPGQGVLGGALRLDGRGDFIDLGEHADFDFGAGSFTVAGWMRAHGAHDHVLLGKGDSVVSKQAVWSVRLAEEGRLRVGSYDPRFGLRTFETAPGEDLRDNRWHFLAGVFDRERREQSSYLDGQLIHVRRLDDLPADRSLDSSAPLKIGQSDEVHFAEGLIDEVALFDRALDAKAIRRLFESVP